MERERDREIEIGREREREREREGERERICFQLSIPFPFDYLLVGSFWTKQSQMVGTFITCLAKPQDLDQYFSIHFCVMSFLQCITKAPGKTTPQKTVADGQFS